MANIITKDSQGKSIYLKATGTGSNSDPHVTQQDVTVLNNVTVNANSLPLPQGAATEQTTSSIKSLNEAALGQKGHTLVTNSNSQTGTWIAIQIVEAAMFTSLTCANTTTPAINVELPVGFILYGNITAFTLANGKVIAYKG